MHTTMQSRVGLMLGLACGDKNGGPLRMALVVMDSIIRCKGALNEDDLFAAFTEWSQTPDCFDTGNCFLAVMKASQSMPRKMAAENYGKKSAGPNAAHRGAAVALLSGDVAEIASRLSRITHTHPEAVFLAQISALICRALIDDPWRGVLPAARREAVKFGANVPESFRRALESPAKIASTGGYAPEVFAAALLFSDQAESFADGLEASIVFAGPANYAPVLVGQFLGAKFGVTDAVVLEKHLKHLPDGLRERYTVAAKKLAESDF